VKDQNSNANGSKANPVRFARKISRKEIPEQKGQISGFPLPPCLYTFDSLREISCFIKLSKPG